MNLNLKTPVQYIAITLPLVIIAVLICVFYVDRPVAAFMAEHYFISRHGIFSENIAATLTYGIYILLIPGFCVYFFARVYHKNNHYMRCFSLISSSVVFAFFMKSALQFLFGREGVHYFNSTTVLFLRNSHLYHFNWFHFGGAFPSGHMSVLSAALIPIILYFPKTKPWLYGMLGIVAALLIITDYHFVSDIIAGMYLGISTALALHYLAQEN